MLKHADLDSFKLDILRPEVKNRLCKRFPEADAFQQLCCDLLVRDFQNKVESYRFSLYPTPGRDA